MSMPKVEVNDRDGNPISLGTSNELPRDSSIVIRAEFDEYVLRSKNPPSSGKVLIKADEETELDSIEFGEARASRRQTDQNSSRLGLRRRSVARLSEGERLAVSEREGGRRDRGRA